MPYIFHTKEEEKISGLKILSEASDEGNAPNKKPFTNVYNTLSLNLKTNFLSKSTYYNMKEIEVSFIYS